MGAGEPVVVFNTALCLSLFLGMCLSQCILAKLRHGAELVRRLSGSNFSLFLIFAGLLRLQLISESKKL